MVVSTLTYFRYEPDDYDYIWAGAITSNVEETIARVREIYQEKPETLTNGGTPESVGKSIWESAQEYLRPPTLEEVEGTASITRHWSVLSCEKGVVFGTIRKLIEHYRKTFPLNKELSIEEREILIRGGFDPDKHCPKCDNTKLRKRINACLECPAEVFTTDAEHLKKMLVVAADWENAKHYCPACQWVEV